MAKLTLEMYGGIITKEGEDIQCASDYLGTVEVEIGATSARTTTDFTSGTKYVIATTDETEDFYFKLGDDTVTATTTATAGNRKMRVVDGEKMRIFGTDGHKRIAVIK